MAANYNENPEVINVLVSAGAKLNAKDYDGATPLMLAAKENHIEVVKALIAAGADIFAADKNCNTVLSYAKPEAKKIILESIK